LIKPLFEIQNTCQAPQIVAFVKYTCKNYNSFSRSNNNANHKGVFTMQNLNLNSSSVQELKDNENAAFNSTLPPWVVQQSDEGCFCIKPEPGQIVADVYTTEADARLMAAAPELLKALEQMQIRVNGLFAAAKCGCRMSDVLDTMYGASEMMQESIKKAKGTK
jgi:hypothetical protein